jgi:hypothetical protein
MGDAGMSPNSTCDVRDGKAIIKSHDENELFWINMWIDEGKLYAFGNDPNLRAELYVSYDAGTRATTLQAVATEPNQAWNPSPRPGQIVAYMPVLSWTKGDNASQHDVYFGTDKTAVENATTSSPEYKPPRLAVGTTSYNPGVLELDTRYYWRIDEVNASGDPQWKGLVWDFKTADYLAVDDFESYANNAELLLVWDDYWANFYDGEMFLETDPCVIRSGSPKAALLQFTNVTASAGKQIGSMFDVQDLSEVDIGSDWTVGGVKALVMWVRGDPCNVQVLPTDAKGNTLWAAGTPWIELEDTSSNTGYVLHPNPSLLVATGWWNDWNIDLADPNFSGVTLSAIDRFSIGIGGNEKTGQGTKMSGPGQIWVDDIALYPSRCVPAFGPALDLTADCIVDHEELQMVVDDWLLSGYDLNSTPPANAPLIRFTFDTEGGSGIKVTNSGTLGSAGNGAIYDYYAHGPGGPLTWETPGANHPDVCDPNYCIQVSGYVDQWVEVNDFNSIVGGGFTTNKLTISAWIKRSGAQYEWTGLVTSTDLLPADEPDVHANLSLGANDDWTPEGDNPALNTLAYHWANVPDACDATPDGWDQIWWWRSGLLVPDGQWTFCAVSIEPEQATMYMLVPGQDLQKAINIETHLPETFLGNWNIGRDERTLWGNRTFNGQIDDVQIYDYALSDSEVLSVAGVASTHVSVPSNVDFDSSDDIDFVDYGYIADQWLVEILWP